MSRCKTCLFALALVLCATPSLAGTLASDLSTYTSRDPWTGFLFNWHGSTSYVGTVPPADLFGDVEWAVYAPGTFPAAFTGYTPDPTHFVYAYQVFETGPAPVSLLSVALFDPAFDIGTFTGGGVSGDPATSEVLIQLDSATWEFGGIGAGGRSEGLAYASPFPPTMGFGVILNDGEVGPVIPLPTPQFISEPTTWTLAALGMFGIVIASFRGRGKFRASVGAGVGQIAKRMNQKKRARLTGQRTWPMTTCARLVVRALARRLL